MKTRITQRRIRAPKRSACGLCKPWKQGWSDKRSVRDRRLAVAAQNEIDGWAALDSITISEKD
jgi:hypothetical protein